MAQVQACPGTTPAAPGRDMQRAAMAGFVGSLMEWYDFFLFGTASALVFGKLFFPASSPEAGTLAAFATFAVGFISRPIGAVLFGHVGDRVGRKTALLATALIMGLGTLAIGLLPTYDSIGVWAPVLLVLLRLLQGLGIGGEWGGASLVALEHAPTGRRGFIGSLPQMGSPMGLLLSTLVFAVVSRMEPENFLAWGWRVPFLLSAVFLVAAVYIRLAIAETPAFLKAKASGEQAAIPIVALFRRHPKNIALATGARLADAVVFNVINVFGIAYAANTLHVERGTMLSGFVIASAVEVGILPLVGLLSDRVGRRPVYLAGVLLSGSFIFAYFPLLASGSMRLAWFAIVMALAVGTGLMFAIQSSFFSELFGTGVRYTGISIGYQLSALIGGAPTPLIASALVLWAGGAWWPVAVYVAAVCALSAVCVWLAAETHGSDLA
ncbi:MFS transporter [Lichenibacterium minor]|uniref:MFS transporter n=1 Tax=Lichenibacterium minor TaxID=2316528 RepID=A0A4Q2U2S6_9HYPH|nr:MFS transporter [Lichenibacterium minor]RYC28995.1 MFS transporter [Lichenibacterium minor]